MRLLAPARRVNMGTADEFALDIMINALDTLSRECAPCARLFSTCPHAQTFAGAVQRSFCAVRCGAVQFLPTIESTCGLACREIRIRQLIIGGINSDWPVPVRVSHGAGSLTDMSTQCPAHHVTSYVRTYVTAGALKRGDTLRRRSRTWTGCRQDWTPRTFKTACCHSACLPMLPMLQAPMEADCCTRFAQRPSMGRRHASQKPHAVARPRWAAAAPTLHRPAPCGCAARRPARPAARPAAPARPRPRPPPPRGTARARPPAPPPPACAQPY